MTYYKWGVWSILSSLWWGKKSDGAPISFLHPQKLIPLPPTPWPDIMASNGPRTMATWMALYFFFSYLTTPVTASFGDYADPTFQCPALTTCRPICVANVALCPPSLSCDLKANQTLCPDGSCAEEGQACSESAMKSPCRYPCAPVACNKVVNTLEQCHAVFDPYYQAEDFCAYQVIKAVQAAMGPIPMFSFTENGFILAYSWMSGITVLIFLWWAYK